MWSWCTWCTSLLKLVSIELVMPSNHLILCQPLLLPTSIFPSIRAFSSESALCIRWPKYWSFSFNISASNEYSGLISFRKPSTLPMSKPTCKENRDSPPSHAAVNQQNPQPQRSVHLWLNLLDVQGTLKSHLQHHSSKASILPCSVFFIVQLSHIYMSTGKT